MGRAGARLPHRPVARLIASLHDDQGDVAVAGLHSGPAADVDYPEDRLRAESGAVAGVEWIGTGSAVERLWTKPALSIIGLDAPKVDGSSNTLVPAARARISLRLAPGDTTANAAERLREHCEQHTPWGAELTFSILDTGEATQIDATGPAYDAARAAFAEAWDGTEPIDMGVGGSIPFIAEFLRTFPEASVLVTGVEDPDTRAHGANEGLHLAEFERVVHAEALLPAEPRLLIRASNRTRCATPAPVDSLACAASSACGPLVRTSPSSPTSVSTPCSTAARSRRASRSATAGRSWSTRTWAWSRRPSTSPPSTP